MRTSLSNIKEIERYIERKMNAAEEVSFHASVQSDPILRVNVLLIKKVVGFVRIYHRKKLKLELEEVHQRLVNDPMRWGFNESVQRIFADE